MAGHGSSERYTYTVHYTRSTPSFIIGLSIHKRLASPGSKQFSFVLVHWTLILSLTLTFFASLLRYSYWPGYGPGALGSIYRHHHELLYIQFSLSLLEEPRKDPSLFLYFYHRVRLFTLSTFLMCAPDFLSLSLSSLSFPYLLRKNEPHS